MKHRLTLAAILLFAAALNLAGITWGLPSRDNDRYLFGPDAPWAGQRIADLTASADWRNQGRAADVDINPHPRSAPVATTDADRAEIYRRYRLYTHQPDEMITLRAIASMHPGRFDFDPKLYQYGGLFLYPVAALLEAGALVGAVDLRPDIAFYLDHPEAFARLYLVARLYVVAFSLAGVLGVYLLATRLANRSAGLVAAALFVLLPVTINMAHEAKPHLPAAVVMIYAVLAAIRYFDRGTTRSLLLLAALCGASFALVLSAWVIFLAIPVTALLRPDPWAQRVKQTFVGALAGILVYLFANPYVPINLLTDSSALAENLANSRAFYPLGNPVAGFFRTVAVVAEGMSPLLATAAIAAVVIMIATPHWRSVLVALVPAAAVLVNMILVGAGKPGEFGRFALFPDIILVILVAAAGAQLWTQARPATIGIAAICAAGLLIDAWRYESAFVRDASAANTRTAAAAWLATALADDPHMAIGTLNDPAPYLTPPLDFARHDVIVLPADRPTSAPPLFPTLLIHTGDHHGPPPTAWWRQLYRPVAIFPPRPPRFWTRPTIISWADKPITIFQLTMPTPAAP